MIAARFVVESPFQLLMANEARDQLDLRGQSELVILWPSGASARESIEDVEAVDPWPVVIDGGVRSTRSMPTRAKLIRQLARAPRSQLFIGDYLSPFMRHLLAEQPKGSAWLLDDGRGTVNTWRLRTDPHSEHPRPDTRTLQKRGQTALLRLRSTPPQVLRYFTIFTLSTTDTEVVQRNELSWLRSRLPAAAADSTVLFLGAPFSERGMMAEDHYVYLVSSIATTYPSIRYRPHRDESQAKLARLQSVSNIQLESSDGTVELSLITRNSLPSKIMSFFSSATVSLHQLVGDKTEVGCFALSPSDFVEGWFATGDGLPTIIAQTGGQITIETMPGRNTSDLDRYRLLREGL